MSMLKNFHGDGDFNIHWDSKLIDKEFCYDEKSIAILDRDVIKLITKVIRSVKDQCRNYLVEKATWEMETDMHK